MRKTYVLTPNIEITKHHPKTDFGGIEPLLPQPILVPR